MKNHVRRIAAVALAGALALGATPAWAVDATQNAQSGLTNAGDAAGSGVSSFNLIKDYDSVNPTAAAPTAAAPLSSSPAEVFTYTITPYAVWNAGNLSGTTTAINKYNMPMLQSGSTTTAAGATLTVTINASSPGAALYNSGADDPYINTNNANDTNRVTINLPSYTTVGDYWYKVEESKGVVVTSGGTTTTNPTTGVLYGTNDAAEEDLEASNGAHTATYYVHVQVTETNATAGTPTLVRNVTLHKTAPTDTISNAEYNALVTDTDGTAEGIYASTGNDKVNAIENEYYAGELKISKAVAGNAGDKSEYFPVTVVFSKAEGTVVNSDITFNASLTDGGAKADATIYGQYTDGTTQESASVIYWKTTGNNRAASNSTAAATATATFWIKDNDTVTFSNIPYGITYTIQEDVLPDQAYSNSIAPTDHNATTDVASFDGISSLGDSTTATTDSDISTGNAVQYSGGISDPCDSVTITNTKNTSIDVGVILDNAPFVALLAAGLAGLIALAARRRKTIEV